MLLIKMSTVKSVIFSKTAFVSTEALDAVWIILIQIMLENMKRDKTDSEIMSIFQCNLSLQVQPLCFFTSDFRLCTSVCLTDSNECICMILI